MCIFRALHAREISKRVSLAGTFQSTSTAAKKAKNATASQQDTASGVSTRSKTGASVPRPTSSASSSKEPTKKKATAPPASTTAPKSKNASAAPSRRGSTSSRTSAGPSSAGPSSARNAELATPEPGPSNTSTAGNTASSSRQTTGQRLSAERRQSVESRTPSPRRPLPVACIVCEKELSATDKAVCYNCKGRGHNACLIQPTPKQVSGSYQAFCKKCLEKFNKQPLTKQQFGKAVVAARQGNNFVSGTTDEINQIRIEVDRNDSIIAEIENEILMESSINAEHTAVQRLRNSLISYYENSARIESDDLPDINLNAGITNMSSARNTNIEARLDRHEYDLNKIMIELKNITDMLQGRSSGSSGIQPLSLTTQLDPAALARVEFEKEDAKFKVIGTNMAEICHLLLACSSPAVMLKVLKAGKLNFCGRGCFVHEQREMVQCQQCQRLGHFRHLCRAALPTCRHCGESHSLNGCTNIGKPPVCSNCTRYNNLNGTRLPTNHRVTNNRCFVKQMRYEGLKLFFAKEVSRQSAE